jgi:hypothetical protein
MHESIFSKAIVPEPMFILNLRMLPYSIGHEVLLQKTQNPLATYRPESLIELPETVRIEAIARAVLICSRDWRGNQKVERFIRLWLWSNRHKDFLVEIRNFLAYRIAGAMDLPTKDQPRSSGSHYHYFGSPETARLLLFIAPLYVAFGYATPYDFPLGMARQLYQTSSETAGNLWIKNYFDMQDESRMKEYEKVHPESEFAMGAEAVRAQAEAWNLAHPTSPVPLPD